MNQADLDVMRQANRAHLTSLWRRREDQRDTLSLEEQMLLSVMDRHREFHALWERLEDLPNELVVGGMNPLAHVVMDGIVEAQ